MCRRTWKKREIRERDKVREPEKLMASGRHRDGEGGGRNESQDEEGRWVFPVFGFEGEFGERGKKKKMELCLLLGLGGG